MQGFFSYARIDQEAPQDGYLVDRIETVLEGQTRAELGNREFHIWRDRKNLLFGDIWKDEIKDALRNSDFLFCLLSPGWLNSEWCRKEYGLFRKVKPDNPVFIIRFRDIFNENRFGQPHFHLIQDLNRYQQIRLDELEDRSSEKIEKQLASMVAQLLKNLRKSNHLNSPQVLSESVAQRDSAEPAPAIPLAGRRIVDGSLDMTAQSSDQVLLDIGFIERAVVKLRGEGNVYFGVKSASLTTQISSGRINSVRTEFGQGYNPKQVIVTAQPTAERVVRHVDMRRCDGKTLAGNPLCDRGESGAVDLFTVADADPNLEIFGSVRIDATGLLVEEEESNASREPSQQARATMLPKLAERILKKFGSEYELGAYRRGQE